MKTRILILGVICISIFVAANCYARQLSLDYLPYIVNHIPEEFSIDNSEDTNVYLKVQNYDAQIIREELSLEIDHGKGGYVYVIRDGYPVAPYNVDIVEIDHGYSINYQPKYNFKKLQRIKAKLSALDEDSNFLEDEYSFGVGYEGDVSVEHTPLRFIGEQVQDWLGGSSATGDVNGDGLDDILIGAYMSDKEGKTYLILGKTDLPSGHKYISEETDVCFIGENDFDKLGYSLAIGDVNGDGLDDILIGAYGNDDGGDWAGKTYLILGKTNWLDQPIISLSEADASFVGENEYDISGVSLAIGDVNGDGLDDILIGARGYDEGVGKTYLVLGKTSGWQQNISLSEADASFVGENRYDNSGCSVACGDITGDGIDDILIGAWANNDGGNWAGKTYLILGRTNWPDEPINLSQLTESELSFIGEHEVGNSGYTVCFVGDVNGDSRDDILISAPGRRYEKVDWPPVPAVGTAYLILSSSLPSSWPDEPISLSEADASFVGEDILHFVGDSVCGGDINGDGLNDILIGTPFYTEDGSGKIYLILGRTSWPNEIPLFEAEVCFTGEYHDYLGESVASGDFEGDGLVDIVIGATAPYEDRIGLIYLIHTSMSYGYRYNRPLIKVGPSIQRPGANDIPKVNPDLDIMGPFDFEPDIEPDSFKKGSMIRE